MTRQEQISSFIKDFNTNKTIEEKFSCGYCYHFAVILNNIFAYGEICRLFPDAHIVWKDKLTGLSYDVKGTVNTKNKTLIPIEYIEDELIDYKHIPGECRKDDEIPGNEDEQILYNFRQKKNLSKIQ